MAEFYRQAAAPCCLYLQGAKNAHPSGAQPSRNIAFMQDVMSMHYPSPNEQLGSGATAWRDHRRHYASAMGAEPCSPDMFSADMDGDYGRSYRLWACAQWTARVRMDFKIQRKLVGEFKSRLSLELGTVPPSVRLSGGSPFNTEVVSEVVLNRPFRNVDWTKFQGV